MPQDFCPRRVGLLGWGETAQTQGSVHVVVEEQEWTRPWVVSLWEGRNGRLGTFDFVW